MTMIAKLDYEDLNGYGIQAVVNKKTVNLHMYVITNEFNIKDAIFTLAGNRYVVAIEYNGSLDVLRGLNYNGLNVIIKHSIENRSRQEIEDFIQEVQQINSFTKIILKVAKDFSDMREVLDFSKKYRGIAFCGGYLLRIPGAKIGCVQLEDIQVGKHGLKTNIICEGCACIMESKELADFADAVFLTKEEVLASMPRNVSVSAAPREKKSMSGLFEIDARMSNF